MATLTEILGTPPIRQRVIDGCARLVDSEVARKRGLRAMALKAGYRLIKGLKPAFIPKVIDFLLDEFCQAIDPFYQPTRGWLTSRFGPRISPFTGRRHRHAGIDIAARNGTPITAPARGRVVSISTRGPLGNSVTIDHGFGVKTFYGHNDEIFVNVGSEVDRGQKIASVGSTGRSTGPHLHYSVQINGKARDPLNYIFD